MATLASALRSTTVALHADRLRSIRERIDPDWVSRAIERGEALSVRRRKMPPDVVVWLILGVCLFGGKSFADVVRSLGLVAPTRRGTVQALPTSGAVAQARRRLGSAAMCELFRISAEHWAALPEFEHLRFHGLHVLAADGVTLRVADTPSNCTEFGKPSSRREEAAYPQVRGVCVADATTHMVLDAAFGAYTDAEVPLFTELIERLPERSVTILDRNFNAYGILHRVHDATKERHWLVRAKRTMAYREISRLGDGDTLVELQFSPKARAADPTLPPTCEVRRIEYSVKGKQFVVITSMVDAERFPAAEVAALYASRWELEMVFDDVKTEQRDAAPTLRSKLPDGVYQELYGLFIAHNLVRVEMARAAVLLRVSPTRISFHRSLQVICDHLVYFAHTSAPSKLEDREWELRRLLQHLLLPERRSHRRYPRVLKTVVARYPRKTLSQAQAST